MTKSDRVLELQVRNKYGRELIYPINETAKLLAQLAGRKTLLEQDIKLALKLGYTVEWVPQSVEL